MVTTSARFTRKDYERLPEGFPAQLVDGALVKDPAPTPWHQRLVLRIARALEAAVGEARVLVAPTDVFLDDWNAFQPDVLLLPEGTVVRPETREAPRPDLVVEVLSPATAGRDRRRKAPICLEHGISEVWLADPEDRSVEVRTSSETRRFADDEPAESRVAPGFRLVPRDLFRP